MRALLTVLIALALAGCLDDSPTAPKQVECPKLTKKHPVKVCSVVVTP